MVLFEHRNHFGHTLMMPYKGLLVNKKFFGLNFRLF